MYLYCTIILKYESFSRFSYVSLIFNYWYFDIGLFVLRSSNSVQLSKKMFGIINERWGRGGGSNKQNSKTNNQGDVYLALKSTVFKSCLGKKRNFSLRSFPFCVVDEIFIKVSWVFVNIDGYKINNCDEKKLLYRKIITKLSTELFILLYKTATQNHIFSSVCASRSSRRYAMINMLLKLSPNWQEKTSLYW